MVAQSTLDSFVRMSAAQPAAQPAPESVPVPAPIPAPVPAHEKASTDEPKKRAPRLQAGGTSTVLRLVEAAREHDQRAQVLLVTLSWRHRDTCGADRVVVAKEPRGAALDFRPPSKPKKGQPKEPPSTMSPDELCGLLDVGDHIADLLLEDPHNHVVVVDGYPKGEIYARFALAITSRCLKLRRCGKEVSLRATAPADPTCKAVLARLKACRSLEAMRAATLAYYHEVLADCFP